MIKKFLNNQEGSTAIEYALIAALISVILIGSLTSLGSTTSDTYEIAAEAFVTE